MSEKMKSVPESGSETIEIPTWDTELTQLTEPLKILDFVNELVPEWICHVSDRYDPGYTHLQGNWEKICNELKISPQKIILVSELPDADLEDRDRTMNLLFLCDFLTNKGFVIRRNTEFIINSRGLVIPNYELYSFMKDKKLPVPAQWEE